MKLLVFGDVVGKVGRHGVRKILTKFRAEYQPDFVLANAENLAHGTGITPKTIAELTEAGVDFFTSGNHVWDKQSGEELLQAPNPLVLRPYNYGPAKSGKGVAERTAGGKKLLIINLQAQVFMKDEVSNPFHALDEILTQYPAQNYDAIFVDFHGEATSEKVAFGYHCAGRVSAIVGTHTHVPTADARILEGGTAYITDLGMTGARDSVIGVEKSSVLPRFLKGEKSRFVYAEEGDCDVNAVLIEIGENRIATSIKLLQTTISV